MGQAATIGFARGLLAGHQRNYSNGLGVDAAMDLLQPVALYVPGYRRSGRLRRGVGARIIRMKKRNDLRISVFAVE